MKKLATALALLALGCSTPSAPPEASLPPADAGTAVVGEVVGDGVSYHQDVDAQVRPPPPDPRTLDQRVAAACTGAHPEWLCPNSKRAPTARAAGGVQSPVTPPTWTVRDWYVDPSDLSTTASDANDCVTAATACLTFGEVIQHRLGTFSPRLQQITVFHKLSAQPPGQDVVFFTPFVALGGQAQLVDTLVPLDGGVDATVGAVVAKQPDAGQLLHVAGLPAGAVAGMFVCDVTQGNSCAFIDSIDGGGATMQQPLTQASFAMPSNGLPAPAENNAWTTGDKVNVFTENATNLKAWNPVGGDVNDAGGGGFSGGWVQFSHVVDVGTGSPPSDLPVVAQGVLGFGGCQIDPRTHTSILSGRGNPAYFIGNTHVGAVIEIAGGIALYYGGGYAGGLETFGGSALIVGGDAIIHAGLIAEGMIIIQGSTGGAYSDGVIDIGSSGTVGSLKNSGSFFYGPSGMQVFAGSVVKFSSWNNLFITGALQLEAATTGCVMSVPAGDAGVVNCGIPLTTANLTTYHTLKSFNNGATFTDGTN